VLRSIVIACALVGVLLGPAGPSLVRFRVTVTGPLKSLVPRLQAQDFRISEDGVEQEITFFAPDIQPLSLGIIHDGGTTFRDATRVFLESLPRGTEYFLMTGDTVTRPFGIDLTGLPGVYRNETTSIENVYIGLDVLKESAYSRKALLVLSDVVADPPDIEYYRQHAIRQDVPAYVVLMADGIGGSPTGVNALKELTELTGGEIYFGLSDSTVQAEDFARQISQGLKNQYIVGYVPRKVSKDRDWRKLRIALRREEKSPKLSARIKSGYYTVSSE
jgi:Ca-activated chloride channel homolog